MVVHVWRIFIVFLPLVRFFFLFFTSHSLLFIFFFCLLKYSFDFRLASQNST